MGFNSGFKGLRYVLTLPSRPRLSSKRFPLLRFHNTNV